MSTDAQIAANQANAQLSTGPVTEAGRAASSRNNLRHGFRSQTVLLPGDDPAEYDALLAELTAHFNTDDLTEERFVREMADAEWRLRRVRQYMEAAISCRMESMAAEFPGLDLIAIQGLAIQQLAADGGASYSTWLRYETKYERQYERAYQGWSRYQDAARRARDKDADIMMREVLFGPTPGQLASNVQNSDAQVLSAQAATRAAVVRGSNIEHSNVQNPGPDLRSAEAPPSTPRNAPCPCGSGDKFKRCCGKSAPPVLNMAA